MLQSASEADEGPSGSLFRNFKQTMRVFIMTMGKQKFTSDMQAIHQGDKLEDALPARREEKFRPKSVCCRHHRINWPFLASFALILLDLSTYLACSQKNTLQQKGSNYAQHATTTTTATATTTSHPNKPKVRDQNYYSPNNRAGQRVVSSRFGERLEGPLERFKGLYVSQVGDRRLADTSSASMSASKSSSPVTVWSQPDPRKSYSLPLSLGSLSLRGLRRNKTNERPWTVAPKKADTFRRSELSSVGLKGSELSVEHPTRTATSAANANPNVSSLAVASSHSPILASNEDEQSSSTDWRSTEQRTLTESANEIANSRKSMYQLQQQQQPPLPHQQSAQESMVTLIRYMPVLMNVPAEQFVGLPGRTNFRSTPTQGTKSDLIESNLVTTTPPSSLAYYGPLYSIASQQPNIQADAASTNRLVKYQLDSPASNFGSSSAVAAPSAPYDFDPETYAHLHPATGSAAAYGQTPHLVLGPAQTGTGAAYMPGQPLSMHQIMASSAGQSGPQATSKALSAYASKLISMLRPSSLLSSIGQPPSQHFVGQAPNGPMVASVPPAKIFQIPSQAQIYLLAPAMPAGMGTGDLALSGSPQLTSGSVASSASGARQPIMALPLKSDDMLLNQASKLSSMSSKASFERPWIHQHPNGLICIHHMVFPPKASVQSIRMPHLQTIKPASQQIVLAFSEPLGTTGLPQQQQQQQQQQLDPQDYSSFDYVATSSSIESTKIRNPANSLQRGPKESPIRIAQKARKHPKNKGDQSSYGDARYRDAQHQSSTKEEAIKYSPQHQKQTTNQEKFMDLIPENPSPIVSLDSSNNSSRSSSSTITSTKATSSLGNPEESGYSSTSRPSHLMQAPSSSTTGAPTTPAARWQHKKRSGSKSIIPFTIKDKIETPLARKAGDSGGGGAGNQLTSDGYPVVQYDEPSEGEIDTHQSASIVGKDGGHRFVWPPLTQIDEKRRSNTTFVAYLSPRARKTMAMSKAAVQGSLSSPPDIDYKKEGGPNNGGRAGNSGYNLPLLMASSSISAARGRQRKESLADLMVPNVTGQVNSELLKLASSLYETTARPTGSPATELTGAASSPVSTSSTIDGQPVLLSSGPIGRLLPETSTSESTIELIFNSTSEQADTGSRHSILLQQSSSLNGGRHFQESGQEFDDKNKKRSSWRGSLGDKVVEENKTEIASSSSAHDDGDEPEALRAPRISDQSSFAVPTNHLDQSTNNNAFDNDKLLTLANSGGVDSMEEFGRISEALQMNPLDLIDLQNSRSNFELPSQLESLSMLLHGTHRDPYQVQLAAGGTSRQAADVAAADGMDSGTEQLLAREQYKSIPKQQQQQQQQQHFRNTTTTSNSTTMVSPTAASIKPAEREISSRRFTGNSHDLQL